MNLRMTRMTAGLAFGTALAVVVACGLGTYLYSHRHFQTLLRTARGMALSQSELIKVALEHQMMENDRSLIDQMIQSFGKEPGVAAVVLLDREGQARYSSVPLGEKNDLTLGSPTCQACHQFPPEQRTSSRVIETRGGQVLRTVVPIRNREPCYRCHDPSRKINGVLIVDVDSGAMRAEMNHDLRWMAIGSGAIMLVLVGAIGLLVRILVMRRLERFETTARRIAAGDLEQRVPAGGSDTVDWLAREFNSMADSMHNLLGDVRSQRERLETVINSIDDGIVVLDTSRNVVAANDAFLKRTDRGRVEVLGVSCGCAGAGICGLTDCPTLACLGTGDPQVRICERKTGTGETVWEEIHTSPILDPTGTIVQVVEVWRDISKRRAAEAQLADSHRLASLGLLASGFSHELNTPLATILTCVEGILRTLRSQEQDPGASREQIEESARIAREQLLRCRGITQHFLRLSRGKESQATVVDLGATVEAVVPLIAPTARAHSVEIEVDPPPPDMNVRVNEAELQQVLLNLLLNAVQASLPHSRVRLTIVPGDPIRLRVSDAGCGIAPADQKKIFEPFFSLREGGTGLGLFLSLDFVRRWGGDITIESAVGSGSTFEVSLPAVLRGAPRPGVVG
jgi:signal transduction histidine kinase/HAMP domain-containing protein